MVYIVHMDKLASLIDELKSLSGGEKVISFTRSVSKTKQAVLGVKVPLLRKIAVRLYKSEDNFIFSENSNIYELTLLEGLFIREMKERSEVIKRLEAYFEKMDSWAHVDTLIPLKAFKECDEDFSYFFGLLSGEREFVIRFGIVGLMKYFLHEDYERVLEALKVVKCEKYYVLMAEAWLISEILIQNSQNAFEIMQKIIKNNHFNRFVINMSIQKAVDSFRVDEKEKEKLKRLKV